MDNSWRNNHHRKGGYNNYNNSHDNNHHNSNGNSRGNTYNNDYHGNSNYRGLSSSSNSYHENRQGSSHGSSYGSSYSSHQRQGTTNSNYRRYPSKHKSNYDSGGASSSYDNSYNNSHNAHSGNRDNRFSPPPGQSQSSPYQDQPQDTTNSRQSSYSAPPPNNQQNTPSKTLPPPPPPINPPLPPFPSHFKVPTPQPNVSETTNDNYQANDPSLHTPLSHISTTNNISSPRQNFMEQAPQPAFEQTQMIQEKHTNYDGLNDRNFPQDASFNHTKEFNKPSNQLNLQSMNAPQPQSTDADQNDVSKYNQNGSDLVPRDVVHIDDVEWAEENSDVKYPYEMAVRPRFTREDPCMCTPCFDERTNDIVPTPCCVDDTCILYACQIECGPNCPVGDLCSNKRIKNKQWKQVEVIDAGKKGLGLRALEDIKPRDFVIEYTGVAIKKEYLDGIFRRYKMERMLYIMALDNNVYIDARKRGGIARYINHSCDPNCAVHRWKVRGISRAGIFALRPIKRGEELSFDYKWKRKRGRAPTKCYCGASNCRGTLEDMLTKTEEEENEEMELEEHWKEPLRKRGSRHEIMNRTIKIYSKEEGDFIIADVCNFDENDKMHCIIYRGEIEETWINLNDKNWMILDEQMEKFVIGRKVKYKSNPVSSDSRSTTPQPTNDPAPVAKSKTYVIVQTPMKEIISSKFIVDRCQRHYRVQVSVSCIYESSAADKEEALDEANALSESLDGHAWKYSITGMNPVEAREYLEKNIADFDNRVNGEKPNSEKKNESQTFRHEIVVPRCIVDHVKHKMQSLRSNCKNAEITFTASRSKSKQFAKIIIESSDKFNAGQAQIILWKEVLTLCNAHGAPKTPAGLFKDLAFYGGDLSQDEFNLLCPQLSEANINYDCCENLRETADMAAFEDFFRCTVWVQAVEDIGRINGRNQLENATPSTRKIFFGCEPQRIPELWSHVKNRINEVSKGVHFFNMNDNKDSLLFMSKNFDMSPSNMPSCFFDYLNRVSGANVQMDNFCSSALRIDGGSATMGQSSDTQTSLAQSSSTSSLAEEIIRLQIEIFRDNKIRKQRWGFGRDWSLFVNEAMIAESDSLKSSSSRLSSSKTLHKRNLVNICMETTEITQSLGLDSYVASHAVIILYRYLTQVSDETLNSSQTRQRDLSMVCLFLANKCQKAFKWKRLESLLEGAYKVYYHGAKFNYKGDEAKAWEKRLLSLENDLLKVLDYDIFWSGADWITEYAAASGHMNESLCEKIMELTLSGPVLAAGPVLWLKLGPEYVFTAMTALYNMDFIHLFSCFKILPLKLVDAVELLTDSILSNRKVKQNASRTHEFFNKSRETFSSLKEEIKQICENHLTNQNRQNFQGKPKQYEIIARRSARRRVFRGVNTNDLVEHVLDKLQMIRDRSLCNIYIEEGKYQNEDVILEGSWRGIAIAEHLICELLPNLPSVDDDMNISSNIRQSGKILCREYPGVVKLSSVSTVDGWSDISESGWKSKIGGKTCVPGKVESKSLAAAGMRWWLQPNFIPTTNGSLCHMLSIRKSFPGEIAEHRVELGKIAAEMTSVVEGKAEFPLLCNAIGENPTMNDVRPFTPVSLHRWPPEKTEAKERSKGGMGVGMSPSALQEMHLLNHLHFLVPSPNGHPNFVLPIAIALDDSDVDVKKEANEVDTSSLLTGRSDDLLVMLQTFDEAKNRRRKKLSGAHIIFHPTPMILQRVMSKGRRRKNDRPEAGYIPSSILTAWTHDLLSAIAHCHTNHVVLRTLHPDQILIDNSGVSKMSGLSRSIVLHPNDRDRFLDPLSSTKLKNKKSAGITDEDITSNPYMAPELLLGANRYNQQSDIWALASLIAHMIIGKPLFSGRDRKTKMRAIFKIVGSSSSNNYKEAQAYPFYDTCKTDKKYKSGVGKAIRYMFKDSEATAESYSDLLQLLEKMLVLDPRKRISALDALEEPCMTDFINKTTTNKFRREFVGDWITMKDVLCDDEEKEVTKTSTETKRSFSEIQTVSNAGGENDEDDLYDLGDMDWKRSKLTN